MWRDVTKLKVLLLLLGLALIAIGCFPSHPQSTFEAAGPVAQEQLDLFYIIFWAAVFVFVVVQGALVYTIFKFRRRAGANGLPKQTHGNTRLEVAWTIAPAIVLAIIAVPTVDTIFSTANVPEGEVLNVTVTAHQWWWEFDYPDLGISTANELHVPVGKNVDVILESKDVIHSFWIPKLAGKVDIVPNNSNTMWFRADESGEFYGQCAEFCGTAHAQMRFRVFAQPQDEFDAWVEGIRAEPGEVTGLAAQGEELFSMKGFDGTLKGESVTLQRCAICHTVEGQSIKGDVGPNLTHIASRSTLAAGIIDNNEENLRNWLRNPDEIKPGVAMPVLNLTEEEIDALVAYLQSLQ